MVFVEGEPVLFMGRGERKWREKVRSAVALVPSSIRLQFTVASLLRWGNRFDIDNMCKPVLDALGAEFDTIWATTVVGDRPGVTIAGERPPAPYLAAQAMIADPPRMSVRRDDVLAELVDATPIRDDGPLGCHLRFGDPDAPIGDFGFEGPIKPLIDALWPLLGGEAHKPADHRIHDLRVERGVAVQGVEVTVWECQTDPPTRPR